MTKFGLKPNIADPFIISTETALPRALLQGTATKFQAGSAPLPSGFEDVLKLLAQPSQFRQPVDQTDIDRFGGPPKTKARKDASRGYMQRATVAIGGGLSLVVPMIIMVLRPSFVTSLVTTSVCVIVFSLVIPSFLDGTNDVLSATAAYAAVLVVFVGTSS